MDEAVGLAAAVQYGDMSGTVTLDEAGFVRLNELLGMPDREIVVGVELIAFDPGLLASVAADSSRTSLVAYTFNLDDLPPESSLPELVEAEPPPEVTKRSYDRTDFAYGRSPDDALALLLQASKRLSLKAWHRSVAPDHIELVREYFYELNPDTGLWSELD